MHTVHGGARFSAEAMGRRLGLPEESEPMSSPTPFRRDIRGSTLVELVMALSLFAMAVGGIYAFVATGGKSARVTNDFLQTQA